MATNWKKILFEGANIDVGTITASDVPLIASADFNGTFKVVSAVSESDEFRFTKIGQSNLQNLQGGTTFQITSSDSDTDNVENFNANGDFLKFGSNALSTVFRFRVSGSEDANENVTKHVIGELVNPFPSGSDQLNIISYSLDIGTGFQVGKSIGWNGFYNSFYGSTTTEGTYLFNSQSAYINAHYVSNTDQYANVNPATLPFTQIDGYTEADGTLITPTHYNLWRNTALNVNGGSYLKPPQTLEIAGKRTYYWLSGSYVGGLSGSTNTLGLEDAYSNLGDTTSSLTTTFDSITASSASLAPFFNGVDDVYVDNPNTFLKRGSEFVTSKTVTNPETGEPIDQVTITHYGESDSNNPQGFKVELGDVNNDLVIEGFLSASALELNSDGDVALQINVETYDSNTPDYDTGENGTSFGTTTANSHSFQGVVIIQSESGLNVNGAVTIDSTLPDEAANVANPKVLSIISDQLRLTEINVTNDFGGIISGSSDAVADLFSSSISLTSQSVAESISDQTAIDDLEDGYSDNADSLENTFAKGIYLGTSPSASAFANNDINGSKVNLIKTASFNAMSASNDATDMLKWVETAHASGSALTLFFDKNEFADVSNIFTGSGEIETAVSNLNRYVLDTAGVFTGSNAANADNFTASYLDTDITFISNLADGLAGADADDHFITGAGHFDDVVSTPDLGTLTDQSMSPSQGVLDFYLDDEYQFGATASEMGPDGEPSFVNLTIDDGANGGSLTIEGSLVTVNTANMMVSDQFIMVNSGALRPDTAAVDSDDDKDGGIIIGHGMGSGSVMMYDYSQRTWGFKGAIGDASHSGKVAFDKESSDLGSIVPDVVIRTVLYSENVLNNATDCPTTIPYGLNEAAGIGTMCVSRNAEDTLGDVYVAVG